MVVKKILLDEIIPGGSALAFVIKKGQFLRVIEVEDKQVGDLALFNEHDYTEKLSTSSTRQGDKVKLEIPQVWLPINGITTGCRLFSTLLNPMMTITADTPVPSGVHDFTVRSCSYRHYEKRGCEPRDGCLDLQAKALEIYGIAMGNIPDPMNIFMNIHYDSMSGMLVVDEPVARAGDYVEFRAELDCLGALSACPDNCYSLGSGRPPHPLKPLRVQIIENNTAE